MLGWSAGKTQEIGERVTQRKLSMRFNLLVKFLQNSYETSHSMNFIAFVRTQPFVPKRFTGNFSIGSLEFLHFSFVPKGAYFFYPCSCAYKKWQRRHLKDVQQQNMTI